MAERFFHETDGAADLLLFGALTAFAVLLGKSAISFFLAQREETQKLVLVRVQRKEREVTVRALWDTGNLLTDPATGLAVSVGEREAFTWQKAGAGADRIKRGSTDIGWQLSADPAGQFYRNGSMERKEEEETWSSGLQFQADFS